MIKEYDKLVRDNVPDIIARSGKIFAATAPSNNFELNKYRKEKVLEEIQELQKAVESLSTIEKLRYVEDIYQCKEELVDVIESLWYFLYNNKFEEQNSKDLFNCILEKRKQKGAFDKNIILKEVRDKEWKWK